MGITFNTMATYKIHHLLSDDNRFTTCNNDLEFIQFVNRIQTENEDEHTYDVEQCITYINKFCDNLRIVPWEYNGEKEFEFFVDVKHTVWTRTYFSITSMSYEEALKVAKRMYDEGEIPDGEYDEILYDTLDPMTLDQNSGFSTIEVHSDNFGIILGNGE